MTAVFASSVQPDCDVISPRHTIVLSLVNGLLPGVSVAADIDSSSRLAVIISGEFM